MYRFLSLVVLLFLFLVGLSSPVTAADLDLLEIFAKTGAELQETEFQAWIRLDKKFSEPGVDKLLAEITSEFGYETKGTIQSSSFRENFHQAFVMVGFFEAEGWLTVQRMQNLLLSSEIETYLGLRALRTGAWPNLKLYRERVTSDFLKYGPQRDLQFFTTLIGTISRELAEETRKEILAQVKEVAQAIIVENYHQDNLHSISLFTPGLPDLQQVGEKKMNLHLAFRYNEFEDQTYVYLGTPIIAPDY